MTKLDEFIKECTSTPNVKESGLSRLGIETDRRAFICGTNSFNVIKQVLIDRKDFSTLELEDGGALLIGRLGYDFKDDSETEPTLFLSEIEDEKFELYNKMDDKSIEIIKTIMDISELKDGLITGYGVPELSSIVFDCVSSFYDNENKDGE
jgi:hypothetical protein